MIDQVMACEEVVRMLRQHATYVPLVEVKTDEDVAFQMISDDLNDTLRQVGGEGSVRGSSTACGGGSPSLCVLTTM